MEGVLVKGGARKGDKLKLNLLHPAQAGSVLVHPFFLLHVRGLST